MIIERNIIFLYPLSPKLHELKEELDKDENIIVYELDSTIEYAQLIGILDFPLTFSADLKKTMATLNENKKFTRKKTSRNFLVQDKTLTPGILNKYQNLGLDEMVDENSSIKVIQHKINMFYNPLEAKAKMEEAEKNKAVMSNTIYTEQEGNNQESKDTGNSNERLRVEKMAIMDEGDKELKRRKDTSGFATDLMFNSNAFGDLALKQNGNNNDLLNSKFSNLQRKAVTTFDPVVDVPKIKKSSFTAVEKELNQNKKKTEGIDAGGELKRKKVVDLGLEAGKLERKQVGQVAEVDNSDINKKKGTFTEVAKELKKKDGVSLDLGQDLERKKQAGFDEVQAQKNKRGSFDEIEFDTNKKGKTFEEVDRELSKQNGKLDFPNEDYDKKRKQFEEADIDPEKKKKLDLELRELERKKVAQFEEITHLNSEKKKAFEEVEIENGKIKKLDLEFDMSREKKNGKFEEVQKDYKKKKGLNLEFDELQKEKKTFEEVELDNSLKRKTFEEVDGHEKKEHAKFEEFHEENEKKPTMEFLDLEKNKKHGKFEEVKRSKKLNTIQNIDKTFGDGVTDASLKFNEVQEFEEQTIDYSKFKKKKGEDGFFEEEIEEGAGHIHHKQLKELLGEPEYKFFENKSYGIEYLVIHNNFLLQEASTSESLFKFIHFALMKEYNADISFYLVDDAQVEASTDIGEDKPELKSLYCGHRARENKDYDFDFNDIEDKNLTEWVSRKLPYWKDETYQVPINEFIYPYFEEGKYLGFAISHFVGTVKNHDDAAKVELLAMCLKGTILEEFSKPKEK